jgi:hypothetical protein
MTKEQLWRLPLPSRNHPTGDLALCSHLSKNAPSLQGVGHAGVARNRHCGVTVAPDSDDAAPDFQ